MKKTQATAPTVAPAIILVFDLTDADMLVAGTLRVDERMEK
jgi:hypothetical protein